MKIIFQHLDFYLKKMYEIEERCINILVRNYISLIINMKHNIFLFYIYQSRYNQNCYLIVFCSYNIPIRKLSYRAPGLSIYSCILDLFKNVIYNTYVRYMFLLLN